MIAAKGSKGTTEKEKTPTHRVGGELRYQQPPNQRNRVHQAAFGS